MGIPSSPTCWENGLACDPGRSPSPYMQQELRRRRGEGSTSLTFGVIHTHVSISWWIFGDRVHWNQRLSLGVLRVISNEKNLGSDN